MVTANSVISVGVYIHGQMWRQLLLACSMFSWYVFPFFVLQSPNTQEQNKSRGFRPSTLLFSLKSKTKQKIPLNFWFRSFVGLVLDAMSLLPSLFILLTCKYFHRTITQDLQDWFGGPHLPEDSLNSTVMGPSLFMEIKELQEEFWGIGRVNLFLAFPMPWSSVLPR